MAEGIIFPFVADLLSKFASAAFQEIGQIYGVEEEFANLKDTFSDLQAVLLDAERKGDLDHAVKGWLGRLKDAAYDADDLLDELSYETLRRQVITRDKVAKKVRIFFSESNQLAFSAKMARKIKKFRLRLEGISADRTQFQFLETKPDQSTRTMDRETYSFVRKEEVIGRDEEKEEIVKRLPEINEKQNVSVDAIVGVGGLGKTTLAQSVFNHKRVEDAFELRLWVCISDIFDLKIIVEKIIERATDQRPSGLEMESLQRKLRKEIDGKKYLLVMDDLWNEDGDEWEKLKMLLMGGAKGSKILITTRSTKFAEVSEASSPYNLNDLSESNSWILFKQMAFKQGEEPESLNKIEIGKEIARKCMGVPLVIKTIGRLLYFKTSEDEWLSFKNSELSKIIQQENQITQVLKLSYNHLPSHLKQCFAYCSLFPKDYEFKKDKLINLWMAEGFVQSQGDNECLEDVSNMYFMELIWRSIFQDVKRNKYDDVIGCKMHDLMHDLARSVAGTEYFTSDSNVKNANERTRRVSFDCGGKLKCSALSTSQLKLHKLRTFLLSRLDETETGLETHISSLNSLRVLDLQQLKLPFSIGMLRHLRFLNLSGYKKMKCLPSSITKLHNLQTLNISYCDFLEELPRDIRNLINLRHLDLSYCDFLEELPRDIRNLINLRHLDLEGSWSIKLLPNSIVELQKLQLLNLSGNKEFKSLPISITKLHNLQTLNISYSSLNELPRDIENLINLRHLDLEGNSSIELLPNSIIKLQKLQLLNLKHTRLRELPRDISNLRNLKHLDLGYCLMLNGMPFGLNKLTGLETMNLYAVGPSVSSKDSGLWQLNTLINIKGDLCIRGLHHLRKDSSQANTVNLKDNHGLRSLKLEWEGFDYNPKGIDHDFVVLEKLHPNKNIDRLEIGEYGGVRLSSWVSSLSNLTEILIYNCQRLQYVPRFDRLQNLQRLKLWNLKLMEYVDDNMEEFDSSVFFPSLRELTLEDMGKLKGWWKAREFTPKDSGGSFILPTFHCLSFLHIHKCPKLFSIPSPNSSLKMLVLDGYDDLPSECFQHLTGLHSLYIRQCEDLVMLPDWIGNLSSLEELEIRGCPQLTLLPEGIRQLSSLRKLVIRGCESLEERCRPEIGEDLPKIAHVKEIEIG